MAMQSGPPVVVVPMPDALEVTIQALVRVPKLSDAERLCLKVGWDTLLEGSEAFSKPTLRRYMQSGGKPVVARVMGDHLYLRATVPPNQFANGVSMVLSLLREPLLNAADLEKSISEAKEPKVDAWSAALEPERWREAKPNRAEIVSTFRKVVRPENLTLAFGGAVAGDAVGAQVRRFEDWKPAPERGFVRSWAATPSIALASPDSIGIVELFGTEFGVKDPSLPAQLLATSALALGKSGLQFRFAREAQAWSYRQEGFLQPTADGLRLRLIFAHAGSTAIHEKIDLYRAGLLAGVEKWGQADRLRALEFLRSYFEAGIGTSPIRLLPEGSAIASLEERTHLAAWWRMKFGEEFRADSLMRKIEQVTLESLKETAKSTLERTSARVLVPVR